MRVSWSEPARALPLRWGHYADRYGWGLVLIVSGGIHLQGSNTYTLEFLLAGTTVMVVGWSILPGVGWRRITATLPALVAQWLLLTGPQAMWTLIGVVLAWLIVRSRPWRSYVVLLLPLAYAFVAPRLFEEYRWMPLSLGLGIAVAVAACWAARAIAVSAFRSLRDDTSDQ